MEIDQKHRFTEQARPLTQEELAGLGKTLVVAPHQDDESLGCGGTIRLLTQMQVPVHVIFTTDGSMSHPNSQKYPTEKLIALRESEAVEALKILGVAADQITFLRMKDSELPGFGSPGFEAAVNAFSQVLTEFQPDTIICNWQRDPHQDHRATWQIVDQAIANAARPVRRFEYFVWLWERAGAEDLPADGEGIIWEIDIASAKDLKKRAIEAHVSQTTFLIDDDPEGFTLSAGVLAHFDKDFEILFERK